VGEGPQAALLPAGDERAGRPFVGDRGARRGEGESSSRAFATARDRPGGGCATARAESPVEPAERLAALRADELLPVPACGAAMREDEIEQAQRAEIEGEPEKRVHTHPWGWDSNRRRARGAGTVPNA